MKAADIRRALECGKQSCPCHRARATNTHCPAHDDSAPSLSVTDGDSAVLLKCFTGCGSDAIIEALKARGLWESEKVVAFHGNEPAAVYRYADAEGKLVGEKGRFEHVTDGKRTKDFRWRLPGEERWGGLDGRGMETMPLYNLHAVLENPEATVFVVEGEKAAQALVNRGIVAVCLAGGASQQRFGNALDPLRDRNVVLWPDNDDAGAGLMARIHSYLPNARFVRPLVPEKGDAHDYFEQGGTVDALKALLSEGEPTVTVEGLNAVTVTHPLPAGTVTFAFTEMAASARSLEAGISVKVNAPGLPVTPYRSRVNMRSQSAVSGHVTALNGFYGVNPRDKEGLKWAPLLMTACSLAEEAWMGIDRSVSLADVELVPIREWLVDGLIPLNLVTIPFGMGGGGKSILFGVHLALHALLGDAWLGMEVRKVDSVVVVDYEDTQEEWRLRFEEVGRGMGLTEVDMALLMDQVRWLPGNGIPLVDQAEAVRRLVHEHKAGLMIVDSCISAVGGDLMDTAAAQRLVNWLTAQGRDSYVTTVMLAHNPKNETKEQTLYPYGNVFWHNLPRSTVYVDSKQEDGSRIMDVVLRQRKASRGRVSPIPLRITFPETDGEAISFERLQHIPDSLQPEDVREEIGRKWDIANHLMRVGAQTSRQIAAALNMEPNNVRAVLNAHQDYFIVVRREGRENVWGVVEERYEVSF